MAFRPRGRHQRTQAFISPKPAPATPFAGLKAQAAPAETQPSAVDRDPKLPEAKGRSLTPWRWTGCLRRDTESSGSQPHRSQESFGNGPCRLAGRPVYIVACHRETRTRSARRQPFRTDGPGFTSPHGQFCAPCVRARALLSSKFRRLALIFAPFARLPMKDAMKNARDNRFKSQTRNPVPLKEFGIRCDHSHASA